MLVEVAARLLGCARPTDTVARLGGDEYIGLLDGLTDPEQGNLVALRILGALREPLTMGQLTIHTQASLGVTVTCDPGPSAEDLHRDADTALYQAKHNGRNRHTVHPPPRT